MPTISFHDFQNKAIPTEEQIISSWTQDKEQPLVSVLCTTYNHTNYIDHTLRGFLIQKTAFPFEIIIHDDVSTDGTREKLIEYQNKYPRIIRTILQTENQYSQGRQLFPIPAKIARGKYFSLCDGDDFWIDEEKLSRQIEALESNPEQSICFHQTCYCSGEHSRIDQKSNKEKLRELLIYPTTTSIIKPHAVIIGNGNYIPTASITIRKDALLKMPDWFHSCPVGDYFIQVLSSHPAGAIFIPREMSVYRTYNPGSWNSNTYSDPAKAADFYHKMRASLETLNRHLSNRYSMEIGILSNTLMLQGICQKYLTPGTSPQTPEILAKQHKQRPRGEHDIPRHAHPGINLFIHKMIKALILIGHRITAKRICTRRTTRIESSLTKTDPVNQTQP